MNELKRVKFNNQKFESCQSNHYYMVPVRPAFYIFMFNALRIKTVK